MREERAFRVAVVAALTAVLFCVLAPTASAARTFSSRFAANAQGDITIAANASMTCLTSEFVCPAARAGTATPLPNNNNNARVMAYIDIDDDPATFGSSEATLSLPDGARVLFAGLYYGGRLAAGAGGRPAPDPAARGTVLLRPPGAAGYQPVRASQIDEASDLYQGFVNVTSIVAAAGAGAYRVANIQTGTGKADSQGGGWALVVAYGDAGAPSRNLSVFDGFQAVGSGSPGVTIPLSGFLTPLTGPVRSTVGIVSHEGDLGTTGDAASLNGVTLTNGPNPANNFFNSTISRGGALVTDRDPPYPNTLGFDADLFAPPGVLGNNQTSATVRLTTGGDAYEPGVVTIATDLFAPRIVPSKTVDVAEAAPGQTLTYTVGMENTGDDGAAQFAVTDPIPAGTTYVPGSLEVLTGPNAGVMTDAPGDDQAEFDAAGNRVVARLGTGAGSVLGGALAPGAASSVRFQVRVNSGGLAQGTVIANTARASFTAQTTGAAGTGVETPVAETKVLVPDVQIAKSHTPAFVPGAPTTFTIAVRNGGDGPTKGPVTVSDTLPAAFTVTAEPIGTGWSCSRAGQAVTCTRSDPLAPGANYPPIQIPVRVSPTAVPGQLSNTVTVTPADDADPSNNTAVDDSAVSAPSIDLVVTKTAGEPSVPFGFGPGEPIPFTIRVENRGVSAAARVQLVDVLPPPVALTSIDTSQGTCTGTTCDLGTILPDGAVTLSVVGTFPPDLSTYPTEALTNRVSVTGTGEEANPADNAATATVRPVPVAELSIEKSFAPAQPLAGGPVTYTLRFRSAGPYTTDFTVADVVPAELLNPVIDQPIGLPGLCEIPAESPFPPFTVAQCEFTRVPPGGEATVTLRGTLPLDSAGASVLNRAAVSAGFNSGEFDFSDNLAETTFTVGSVDVGVEKERVRATGPIPVGGEATFRLTARSTGTVAATGVVVTDPLPDGLSLVSAPAGCSAAAQVVTCAAGTIPAGEERTFDVVVRAERAAGGRTLTNRATIAGAEPDVDAANNRDEDQVTVDPVPPGPEPPGPPVPAPAPTVDVGVDVKAPTRAFEGETSKWTIDVVNNGPATATGVALAAKPDGDAAELGASAAGTASGCSAGSTISCALGTLPSGARRAISVDLRPRGPGRLALEATVRPRETDVRPANNEDRDVVNVAAGRATVKITKRASRTRVRAGGRVAYTIVVRNTGRVSARDLTVCDALPDGLTLRRRGGARLLGGRPCWTVGSLAAGRSKRFGLSVATTAVAAARRVVNTATVKGANARSRSARAPIRVLPQRSRGGGVTG